VSALDGSIRAQILNLLRDLRAQLGLSYLFIAHDLAPVAYMSHTLPVMYLGKIVESGEARRFTVAPKHPYNEAIDRLRASLGRLNPTAVQLDAARDPESAAEQLAGDIDALVESKEARRWLSEEEQVRAGHDDDGGRWHGHDVNRHGDDIVAFSVRLDEPLRWSAFAVWLTMLLHRHSRAILQVKGLLCVAGVPTPVVLYGVQHTIHPPTHLAAWPEGGPRTRLIVIAKGLDGAASRRRSPPSTVWRQPHSAPLRARRRCAGAHVGVPTHGCAILE
jgi:hypothetical protein